ncbi:MAG: VWA domain-containing protein [Methylococcaceae bacterium]
MNLVRGQKIKLADLTHSSQLYVGLTISAPSSLILDISCFGLDDKNKLSDDRYFIFYNQKISPCGSLASLGVRNNDQEQFQIDLSRLPSTVRKLVFVVTIDGNGVMSQIRDGYLRLLNQNTELVRFTFSSSDFKDEKAIMVGEIYFKDVWRFSAVGQGFNGGLSALLKHFGGEEITAPTSSITTSTINNTLNNKRVLLEKRIEKEAPQLVNLVKKATVSLQKVGLQDHQAKVALCLDVSGSMSSLYSSGVIQKFAERILALACRFDDDGSIDIFLFADRACNSGEMGIGNLNAKLIQNMVDKNSVGYGTSYAPAIEEIRKFYFSQTSKKSFFSSSSTIGERTTPLKAELPVYVMFVTDGDTSDEYKAEKQIQWSSYEPIFWQFMAIGNGGFNFLKKLDTMSGRYLDNANFFDVSNPDNISDDNLYDLLMVEYPLWVKQAKNNGLINN